MEKGTSKGSLLTGMIYEFDGFRLDEERYELTDRTGELVQLMPLTMDLLLVLIRSPGALLSKEMIMREVWKGLHVSESALTYQLRELRTALSDTEKPHRIIKTVHGKGLRFIAEVEKQAASAEPAAVAPAMMEGSESETARSHQTNEAQSHGSLAKSWVKLAALGATMVAAVLLLFFALQDGDSRPEEDFDAAVAVLPFSELGGEEEAQYLGEGLALELTSTLAQIDRLKVSSSTSAFRFSESSEATIDQIAAALGVTHIVEGSVRREEDAVRIAVQLIEAETNTTVWSQTFNRSFSADNLLRIQDEIVSHIVTDVLGTIAAPAQEEPSFAQSTEAYDLYLRAEMQRRDKSEASLSKAIGYLKQAVAVDPDYVDAHSALALAYLDALYYGGAPPEEIDQGLTMHISRGLELAPNDPKVLLASAIEMRERRLEIREAIPLFQRSLASEPQNVEALREIAEAYRMLGRSNERTQFLRRARQLDPLNPITLSALTRAEFNNGDMPAALEVARASLEWNPDNSDAQGGLAELLIQTGEYEEAHPLLLSARLQNPQYYFFTAWSAQLYASVGWDEGVKAVAASNERVSLEWNARFGERLAVDQYLAANPDFDPTGDTRGPLYFHLRDFETALPLMQKAVRELEITGPTGLGAREVVWYLRFAHVLSQAGDKDGEILLTKIGEVTSQFTPENSNILDISIAAAGARMLRDDEVGALEWLEGAVARGHVFLDLTRDPTFEPLVSNPRYQRLERRMEAKAAEYRATFERQIAEGQS